MFALCAYLTRKYRFESINSYLSCWVRDWICWCRRCCHCCCCCCDFVARCQIFTTSELYIQFDVVCLLFCESVIRNTNQWINSSRKALQWHCTGTRDRQWHLYLCLDYNSKGNFLVWFVYFFYTSKLWLNIRLNIKKNVFDTSVRSANWSWFKM